MISISAPADYEPIVKLYFNLKALFRLLNQRKPVLANLSSLDILAKSSSFFIDYHSKLVTSDRYAIQLSAAKKSMRI
jgi:hypothetical protein